MFVKFSKKKNLLTLKSSLFKKWQNIIWQISQKIFFAAKNEVFPLKIRQKT